MSSPVSNARDLSTDQTPAVENPLPHETPAPAAELEVREPEKVGGIILVDAETQQQHAETAQKFLDELLDAPLHSPEFQTRMAQLTRLGADTMNQAADSRSEEHT